MILPAMEDNEKGKWVSPKFKIIEMIELGRAFDVKMMWHSLHQNTSINVTESVFIFDVFSLLRYFYLFKIMRKSIQITSQPKTVSINGMYADLLILRYNCMMIGKYSLKVAHQQEKSNTI